MAPMNAFTIKGDDADAEVNTKAAAEANRQ